MHSEDSMRRYHLTENEALDGKQVVTVKDRQGKLVWEKNRELEEDEIVSTVYDSLHHPRWRISRPTKGWYLILQRVTSQLADEAYIELKPAKRKEGTALGAGGMELVFTVQTPPRRGRAEEKADSGRKSPSTRVEMSPTSEPLSPSSTAMSPSDSTSSSITAVSSSSADPALHAAANTVPSPSTWVPSTFRITPSIPHTFASEHPHTAGLLGKIKSLVADPKKRWSVLWETKEEEGAEAGIVMAFEEGNTGFFHPHLSGTLSLSPSLVDASGLEPSFWVALCCTYADMVEEREGWEAAKEGN